MQKGRRRKLVLAASVLLAAPLTPFAQQGLRRIAMLDQGSRALGEPRWQLVETRLRELGYSEGKNLVVDRRWAEGVDDQLPRLAAEILAGKPDVVLVVSTPATRALMRLTDTVPIVMIGPADPVATGLVASLARPGGNVTGVSNMLGPIALKRIDLLREIVPKAKRFGLLGPAANPGVQAVLKQVQDASRPHGLEVRLLDADDAPAIARAFERLGAEAVDALLVASILYMHHRQVVELAGRFRIPASYVERDILEAGGLMVLGPDRNATYRHAADYAHRVLRGAKPADLPVMQPTEFWLGINLRTARSLGLKIPPSVLLRANRVIE